jgi:tellurite resistance protein TehA-like permease
MLQETRRELVGALGRQAGRVGPGSFSMVMATGIVAAGLRRDGQPVAAGVVLGIAAVAFVVLAIVTVWRSAAMPAAIRADLTSPGRAFTAFTFTAACGVLGLGLVTVGWRVAGAVLAVAGTVAWLGLTILIPARMAVTRRERPALTDVNGTWYLWAVATQSLAIMAAFLHVTGLFSVGSAVAVALGCWLAGLVIYLLTTALVAARLRRAGIGTPGTRAAYWVAMGAASISLLAAAQILRLGGPTVAAARPWITDTGAVLWVAATVLIPVLAVATVATWLKSRSRPRYRVTEWMVVFPLGMYAAASEQFGAVASVSGIRIVGETLVWLAAAAWLAVLATMVAVPEPLAPRERTPRPARTPLPRPEGRMTRKYQAVVTPLPRSEAVAGPGGPSWADTRAVIRARDHSTHHGQLLTALVTADDGTEPGRGSDLIATMVVVGPHLDDCLGIGDTFTIWRGTDIGLGVITRRLFV